LNTTKTASPHHDVSNIFLLRYLYNRFGRLSGSGERFESDAGTFAFPIASFSAWADACEVASCSQSAGIASDRPAGLMDPMG
jgi:hypothetical protein